MFKFFESRVNAYPLDEPKSPPKGLGAFCWHYTKPVAGWIVETGAHQELSKGKGLYSELWARQSGGFIGVYNLDDAAQ